MVCSSLHPAAPGQPVGVAIDDIPAPTSISLSWYSPSDSLLLNVRSDVQGYTVQARQGDGTGGYVGVADVPVNATKVTISGLLPGNSYSIRVLANNDAGSTPSDPITVTLPARGGPRDSHRICPPALLLLLLPALSPPPSSPAPPPHSHTGG